MGTAGSTLPTEEEQGTVCDYLLYEVNSGANGGQGEAFDHDMLADPAAIRSTAEAGVEEINWPAGNLKC